ncbi:MAG: hypothetical protein U0992_15220 [Planctomycetaceae bacterium]
MWISAAAKRDWPYFARWHYRSHYVGLTRFVTLLWHGSEPVGICLFVAPPISLAPRNRYFGRSGRWERTSLQAMNRQLVMLSRVVLHPTYRGAGIAAAFIRRSCALSGFRWIEALAQMGHVNPFFERAGFVRVGTSEVQHRSRLTHSRVFGGGRHGGTGLVTEETHRKSRHSTPVYYIFDNREPRSDDGLKHVGGGGAATGERG